MPTRLLREGILHSERVNLLDAQEEVFYRRLMSVVDDHGLHDARAAVLRAKLFPLRIDRVREADIARWMAACQKAGVIVLYEADSKPYLQMVDTRWAVRSEPKCPPPPGYTTVNSRKQLLPYSEPDTETETYADAPTEQEFVAFCTSPTCGISEAEATDLYLKLKGRGWKDGGGVRVTDWKPYCRRMRKYIEQERGKCGDPADQSKRKLELRYVGGKEVRRP